MENEEKSGMLDLIGSPAFCVKSGVVFQVNQAATRRMVTAGTAVSDLIAIGKEEYAEFTGGCLYLTLNIAGQPCGASVSRVDGADVFVLEQDADQAELQSMALAARELRTSLASIMTIADRLFPLMGQQNDSTIDEQLARVNRGLFQMLRVISNMSDASRYTTSMPNLENLDIAAVLDEIFEKATALARQTGIQLTFTNLPEHLFCMIDAEKLERAVYNILSNSMKFTPRDGFIHAKLTRCGSKLYLSVQDSGSGIPSRLLGSIYSRFQREPAVEDIRYGIGLGMVLIRSAASMHGGTVLIDQPANQGTRITMTLEINPGNGTELHSPVLQIDYAGERDHGLIELADVLPPSTYDIKNIN